MGLGVCVAVWSATLMDFGWLSGCVGQGATAIALLPTKRFLAPCPLCSRLPVIMDSVAPPVSVAMVLLYCHGIGSARM